MGKIRDSIDRERSRRAVLGTLIGAGVAGVSLSPVGDIVAQFAPFSGDVWRAADPNRPGTVRSPYGGATLRYDEEGVPHIEADDEQALYYAAGHTQAIDRGFQMDLQRRLFSGRLAEVVVGAFGEVVGTGRFAGIALLIGLAGPLLGSLVRGVV